MSEFCPAYKKLRGLEGYYSNRSSDLGLETYAGISRKYWPDSRIWYYVDREKPLKWNEKLKDKRAEGIVEAFYYTHFWSSTLLGEIEDQKVATYIFCQKVNMGKTIIRLVQELLSLKRDGILGSKTLKAINDSPDLLKKLARKNKLFYDNLIRSRPSQIVNEESWLNRIKELT